MQIKLLVEGGEMQPGPALAQKIGPLGLNIGQIIQRVNEATKGFKGLKVPVELDVDASTKEVNILVSSPPVSELLKRELGIPKGSAIQKKLQVANASIEQIISVAKAKQQNLLCKDLKSSVKIVVGTCVSLGILVENMPASEVCRLIDEGKFAKEIAEGKTETSKEKREQLDAYFNELKRRQEKAIEEEKKAQEAAAAAAATTTVATPTEGATSESPKVETKTPEKKEVVKEKKK